MSKHKRDKPGLHKEISSIFKGVPIPKNDDAEQPCEAPASERTSYTDPEPPTPEPQQLCEASAPEHTDYSSEPEPPTLEPPTLEPPTLEPPTLEPPTPEPPTPEPQQLCEASAPEHTDYSSEPEPPTLEPQSIPGPKAFQLAESSSEVAPVQEPEADIAESSSEVAPVQESEADIAESSPEAAPAQQPKANTDDIIEENISKKSAVVVTVTSQNFWQRITNKLFTPKPGVSPTRQKAMVVVVPILFIALIFVFRQVFGTTARKTKGAVENNVASAADVNSDNKINWEIPVPYPTTLRDPMRLGPAATAQTETETRTFVKLILKGILYTEDNPSAVVGGQIVHEGEKIRGATIVKISKDRVEFEMNGQRWSQRVRR